MRVLSSFVPFLAIPALALVHCSGSTVTGIGSSDASTGDDASIDGATSTDATTGDGSATDDSSTSGDDGSTAADSAPADDASTADAAACGAPGTTRAACITCCTMAHPQGAESLASDELACACAPEECGGLEAGEGAADGGAGALGTGACSAECAAPGHNPGATCDMCLRRSVGTMMTHGPCYAQVEAACESDTACKAYATCELTCPAN